MNAPAAALSLPACSHRRLHVCSGERGVASWGHADRQPASTLGSPPPPKPHPTHTVFLLLQLIGLVSEEIKSKLSAVRRGNIPLAQTDHTLVLNWNRQAPMLLRQMAANGHGAMAGDNKSLGRWVGV